MRVTQSMISNNTLRNITNSYSKLATLDQQIVSGKKFNKPSEDPVSAMMALRYRTDLNRIGQYSENISEVNNWSESTDQALDKVGQALLKIRDLTVQISNGTLAPEQRSYVAKEIEQLKEQIIDLGDSQIGGKYIFNGTKTDEAPSVTRFENATQQMELEVFSGIKLPMNIPGADIFKSILGDSTAGVGTDLEKGPIQVLIDELNDPNVDASTLNRHLTIIDAEVDNVLENRAKAGAIYNRVELMEDRLGSQEVLSRKILSDNEDIDMEKAIIDLTTQESIHRAALGIGAKVIQPSLLDFLR